MHLVHLIVLEYYYYLNNSTIVTCIIVLTSGTFCKNEGAYACRVCMKFLAHSEDLITQRQWHFCGLGCCAGITQSMGRYLVTTTGSQVLREAMGTVHIEKQKWPVLKSFPSGGKDRQNTESKEIIELKNSEGCLLARVLEMVSLRRECFQFPVICSGHERWLREERDEEHASRWTAWANVVRRWKHLEKGEHW